MKYDNLEKGQTIDAFVRRKLETLNRMGHTFSNLFELMFSEREGILYERSQGYQIVKTTYGQAYENVKVRAAGLRSLLADAPQDAVVGLHMENSAEWIETFWAILAAGFCPLLLNLRLDAVTLQGALSDCGAVAVVADKGQFPVRTILQTELLTGKDFIAGEFGSQVLVMSTGTSTNVKVCGYGAEEFCCLVNDSVSIVQNCVQIKKHHQGHLKLLTFLPFYHVFGLIALYIWFAFFSRTFVHLQNMEPQTILNTIRRHGVTHIFAVPLFWETIYDKAQQAICDRGEKTVVKYHKGLRMGAALEKMPPLARAFRKVAFQEVRSQIFGESVLFMITGGSPIRPEALRFFNDIGYHLTNGYGMTEIGITSVEQSMSPAVRNSGSVGRPMDSTQYQISPEGELLVKGKSLARTIRQGGKTAVRGDDWFHTGDLAECRDGAYYILGRKDDVILLANGEMLNPNLIEPRFRIPGVGGACLIDAGEKGSPAPTLLLSVKRGSTRPQLEQLNAAVLARLRENRLDTAIRGVEFIPGSFLGENDFKVSRAAMREKYRSGKLQAICLDEAPEQTEVSELERQVAAIFAAILNKDPAQIGLESDFFLDEEGTSLDYFAMLAGLKETYGLPFEETPDTDFHTVRGVCRYIEGAV